MLKKREKDRDKKTYLRFKCFASLRDFLCSRKKNISLWLGSDILSPNRGASSHNRLWDSYNQYCFALVGQCNGIKSQFTRNND